MTRINNHQVIQMVGDDRLVFVDDHNGAEVVKLIVEMPDLLKEWGPLADTGETFGPSESIQFHPREYDAVEQTVNYFIECSGVPIDEQLAVVMVTEVSSLAGLRALLHGEVSS